MDLRLAAPADREAIESVVAAAFGGSHGRKVVEMVRALDDSRATRASLVAVDGELVGHVHLSRGWVDARRAMVEVAVLSPLSVAPDRRRRGVGADLLLESWMVGQLVYPEAFWATDTVGLRDPTLRAIEERL